MRYFKNKNNEVFAYDDEQIKQGLSKDLTEVTEDEMKILTFIEPIDNPKADGEAYSLNGTDYMVPFMKDDGDAVMQVNAGFQIGLTETKIHFSNETIMPIKATEFAEFAIWFVNKRNSFFI